MDTTNHFRIMVKGEQRAAVAAFLNCQVSNIGDLRRSVAKMNRDEITKITKGMIKSSVGYGFEVLGGIANDMEQAARSKNWQELATIIDRCEYYLFSLEVEYK